MKTAMPESAATPSWERHNFPQQLREHRERLGLNQTQAAKLLDVSLTVYNEWETGKREPTKVQRAGALVIISSK